MGLLDCGPPRDGLWLLPGEDRMMQMSTPKQRSNSRLRPSGQRARPVADRRRDRSPNAVVMGLGLFSMLFSLACASQGDVLSLEERVMAHHRQDAEAPDPFSRIAQLSADVDALRQEVRSLEGKLELARKEAADALREAERTRTALAAGGLAGAAEDREAEEQSPPVGNEDTEGGLDSSPDRALASYQEALDAWRADDFTGCIERFTGFLQTWPNSGYADDAAYWLADCTFKNDEFKRAVVRFNAVVSVYPKSPKAPDALYRQGESLLKLGPKFHEAARTVFKRVQKDYPESERAAEASRQLERLGSG